MCQASVPQVLHTKELRDTARSSQGLYRYATKKDAALLIIGILAVLISGANQPLQLMVFGGLSDAFNSVEGVGAKVRYFALLYTLLGIQMMITQALQITCLAVVAARQVKRMREEYFRALARRPLAHFDEPGRDAGAAASAIMERAALVQAGLGDDVAKLLENLSAFGFGIASACYWMWRLALVSLCAVPLLGALVALANVAYSRATKGAAAQLEQATSTPLEAIGAIRTVAAFGREKSLLEAYRASCLGACKHGLALGRAKAALESATVCSRARHSNPSLGLLMSWLYARLSFPCLASPLVPCGSRPLRLSSLAPLLRLQSSI